MLLAPIISSWVPFYYGSSMAIGIFLVVIIILFQVYICIYQLPLYYTHISSSLYCFQFFSDCYAGHEIIANWKKKCLLSYHVWISDEFDSVLTDAHLQIIMFHAHIITLNNIIVICFSSEPNYSFCTNSL
jgi:hypothetical protein